MKFSISSSELLAQLQIAGGAIGSNPVLPILEDFLFTINDNQLTFLYIGQAFELWFHCQKLFILF